MQDQLSCKKARGVKDFHKDFQRLCQPIFKDFSKTSGKLRVLDRHFNLVMSHVNTSHKTLLFFETFLRNFLRKSRYNRLSY